MSANTNALAIEVAEALSAVVGETLKERLESLWADHEALHRRIMEFNDAWLARDFEWLADAGFLSHRTVAALREAEAAID